MLRYRFIFLCTMISWQLLSTLAHGSDKFSHNETITVSASGNTLPDLIYQSSEPFSDIETVNLDGLLERIGNSPVVLIGEASHGTAEFYDIRARITRALIEHKGFNIIAVEGDWPDIHVIDHDVRGSGPSPVVSYRPFGDFPS